MRGIIYLARNKKNGKRYVGQTVSSVSLRWSAHLRQAATNPIWCLHRAIVKHGCDAFELSVLQECSSRDEIDEAERAWIKNLGTLRPYGYNMTKGGRGTSGLPKSEAWKIALSKRMRGRRFSVETKAKMSRAKDGWKPSAEMRAKQVARQTGQKLSSETRRKMSESQSGKKLSGAHVEKLRAVRAGMRLSQDAKDAISRPVLIDGVYFKTLSAAAKTLGVSAETISRRICRGISGYEAMAPVRNRAKRTPEQIAAIRERIRTPIKVDGLIYPSMAAAARALDITRPGLAYRIRMGRLGYERLDQSPANRPGSDHPAGRIAGGAQR